MLNDLVNCAPQIEVRLSCRGDAQDMAEFVLQRTVVIGFKGGCRKVVVLTDQRRALSLKERREACIVLFDVQKRGQVEVFKTLAAFKEAQFLQLDDLLDRCFKLHCVDRPNRMVLQCRSGLINGAFNSFLVLWGLLSHVATLSALVLLKVEFFQDLGRLGFLDVLPVALGICDVELLLSASHGYVEKTPLLLFVQGPLIVTGLHPTREIVGHIKGLSLEPEGETIRRCVDDKYDGKLLALALVHGHDLDAVRFLHLFKLDLKPSEKVKVVKKI